MEYTSGWPIDLDFSKHEFARFHVAIGLSDSFDR